MMELRDITLAYQDRNVLDHVDLSVETGELMLLAGPTGVGKSTLLGVVAGLVPSFTGGVLSGDVRLDGESIIERPARDRAHAIGYVGQNPAAWFVTDTVEEELAFGMKLVDHLHPLDVLLPEAHRQLIGDEPALAGVFPEGAAHLAAQIEGAEDIAGRNGRDG
jgi:ABC-type sugar transport system ATPase subunit